VCLHLWYAVIIQFLSPGVVFTHSACVALSTIWKML
jgi:hypothetical protein